MTDEKRISRRQSLKGLAITGSLFGATGMGIGSVSAGRKNLDQVELHAKCYDPCKGKAEFRVFNNVRKTMSFVYRVKQTGEKGRITVKSDGYTEYGYFWVKAPKGEATVKLYLESKKKKDDNILVDTARSDPDDVCKQHLAEGDVTLEAALPNYKKGDKGKKNEKRYTKFVATNNTNEKVCTSWESNDNGDGDYLCIPANDSKKFSVKVPHSWPEEELVVNVDYGRHTTSAELYPVWNVSKGNEYSSVQKAVDFADKNDKILVFGFRDYEDDLEGGDSVNLVNVSMK